MKQASEALLSREYLHENDDHFLRRDPPIQHANFSFEKLSQSSATRCCFLGAILHFRISNEPFLYQQQQKNNCTLQTDLNVQAHSHEISSSSDNEKVIAADS